MEISKFPLKVSFHKTGEMIYFSQLDLVRVLERALRRSNLPLYFSQGFNPRVKMSFPDALKLGREGVVIITLYFSEAVSPEQVGEKLSCQLPAGFSILPASCQAP